MEIPNPHRTVPRRGAPPAAVLFVMTENGRSTVTVQTLGGGAGKSYLRPSQAHTIRQQQILYRRMQTGTLSPYVQEQIGLRRASRTAPTLMRGSSAAPSSVAHSRPAPQLLRPYYGEPPPPHRASPPLIEEPRHSTADVPAQPPTVADSDVPTRATAAPDVSRAQPTRAARPQNASSSSRQRGWLYSEEYRRQQQLQHVADRGPAPAPSQPQRGSHSRHEATDDEPRDAEQEERGTLLLSATQPPFGAASAGAPSTAAAAQPRQTHATFRPQLRPPLPPEATPTRCAWSDAMAADERPPSVQVAASPACAAPPSTSAAGACGRLGNTAVPSSSATAALRPARPASASAALGTRRAAAVNYREQLPTHGGAPQLENAAAVAAASAAISAAAASAAASFSAAAVAASNLAAVTQGQQQQSQPVQPPPPPPPQQSQQQQQWALSFGGSDRVRQRPASASAAGRQARGADALAGAVALSGSAVSGGGGSSGGAALHHRRGPSLSTASATPQTRDAIDSAVAQRAEIDALRRRTAALQNGASIAARTSAGPHPLPSRHHRPWAMHERRVSATAPATAPAAAASASNAATSAAAPAAPAAPPPASAARPSHRPAPARPASAVAGVTRPGVGTRALARVDDEDEDEAPLNVGDYRRQAQRSLMLSHLRESAASFPGLQEIDWAHLDNQGLHAAVSAIVRVHAALHAAGGAADGEAQVLQQQLSALYAQAGKSGAAGLPEDQLALLPTCECDAPMLLQLSERHTTCAICHDDFAIGDSLRTLPCQHTYHASCVGHWLRIKAACPLCNARVRPVKE